jgi:hypothetical protein
VFEADKGVFVKSGALAALTASLDERMAKFRTVFDEGDDLTDATTKLQQMHSNKIKAATDSFEKGRFDCQEKYGAVKLPCDKDIEDSQEVIYSVTRHQCTS